MCFNEFACLFGDVCSFVGVHIVMPRGLPPQNFLDNQFCIIGASPLQSVFSIELSLEHYGLVPKSLKCLLQGIALNKPSIVAIERLCQYPDFHIILIQCLGRVDSYFLKIFFTVSIPFFPREPRMTFITLFFRTILLSIRKVLIISTAPLSPSVSVKTSKIIGLS